MRIRDFWDIIFRRLKRNRYNTNYIITSAFLFIFILLILFFKSNFVNYITTTITENISARTISVFNNSQSMDDMYEKISAISHVEYVYSSKYDSISVNSSFANDDFDGVISLKIGNEYTLPTNIYGESINLNDTGVAVCPINFYPSSEASDLIVDNSLLIDGRDLLNTTFEVSYYSYKLEGENIVVDEVYTKTFEIIGLYDSSEIATTNEVCYVSQNDMTEIADTKLSVNGDIKYSYFAIVDKTSNVDIVIEELNNLGYSSEIAMYVDTDVFNTIILVCNVLIVIMGIAVIVILASYIKKKSIQDTRNIGVLRSIGYSNKTILFIHIGEIFILNVISLMFSVIIFYIIYFMILQFVVKPYLNIIFNIKVFNENILLVIVCVAIISIVLGFICTLLLLRRNIVKIIRSE